MKDYLFIGVQGSNLAAAVQGLDQLLRTEHAGKNFTIHQVIVVHEMMPSAIKTQQPAVVCNVIAVLISPEDLQQEDPGQQPGKLWIDKGEA